MENIDWKNLGFGYVKTDWNVRSTWRDGQWGALEKSRDENISIHMASTCLHYGQEAFEGLKAFRGADGKVRIFRLEENAKRMIRSAEYTLMAAPTIELFRDAVLEAVRLNEKFIPPYGMGASLYIRPLLIGTGAQVGVKPAKEYMLVVFVTPVGPYFKEAHQRDGGPFPRPCGAPRNRSREGRRQLCVEPAFGRRGPQGRLPVGTLSGRQA